MESPGTGNSPGLCPRVMPITGRKFAEFCRDQPTFPLGTPGIGNLSPNLNGRPGRLEKNKLAPPSPWNPVRTSFLFSVPPPVFPDLRNRPSPCTRPGPPSGKHYWKVPENLWAIPGPLQSLDYDLLAGPSTCSSREAIRSPLPFTQIPR